MLEKLRSTISKTAADYGDIRYEIKKDTRIVFQGKELFHIGSNSTDGFVIRTLKDGGFSSTAYTRADDADNALRIAEENAALIARHIRKPVEFAKTDTVRDIFLPHLTEDPRSV